MNIIFILLKKLGHDVSDVSLGLSLKLFLIVCEENTRGHERSDEIWGEEMIVCIHWSMNRLLRCTNRNVSIIIGIYVTADWPQSMGVFYFMSKGLRKDIEKRRPLCPECMCQTRSCNFRDGGIVVLYYRPAVVWEIKSVRFPWVYLSCKIRHRFVLSLFSRDCLNLPNFCDETQKCVQKKACRNIQWSLFNFVNCRREFSIFH